MTPADKVIIEKVAEATKKIKEIFGNTATEGAFSCLLYSKPETEARSPEILKTKPSLDQALTYMFENIGKEDFVFGRITGRHSKEIYKHAHK